MKFTFYKLKKEWEGEGKKINENENEVSRYLSICVGLTI